MNVSILDIYIALAAFVWVHITGIPAKICWHSSKAKNRIVRILLLLISGKPFNCELCLTFWLVLWNELKSGEIWYICFMKGLIYGGCSALLFKLWNRI